MDVREQKRYANGISGKKRSESSISFYLYIIKRIQEFRDIQND